MPNPYFSFKQFTIHQDNCAMKVCTDACLFGAWVAKSFERDQPEKILEIGTGTGLLTLMLAQQLCSSIDTVEINSEAYLQAGNNIAASKWDDRITIINADAKDYDFKHLYNLVISNPPFYENDLRSPVLTSNIARHDETLNLEGLLSIVSSHLSWNGSFAVLIPCHRLSYLIVTAALFNLFPFSVINVRQTTTHSFFRSMVILKKQVTLKVDEQAITIKEGSLYTPEFIELLKDYYLYL